MRDKIKHEFYCTWGILTMYMDGRRWSVSLSGKVPGDVQKNIAKLEHTFPKPDTSMATFAIRNFIKNELLYEK